MFQLRWQRIRRDENPSIFRHGIEQVDDITRSHSHASETNCSAQIALLGRSMDVDISLKGVFVSFFQAFQPENTCDDWIPAWRVHRQNFSSGFASLKDCSRLYGIADLLLYPQKANRCGIGSRPVAQTEFRCGNGINAHGQSITKKNHFLIRRTHDNLLFWNHRTTRKNEGNKGKGDERGKFFLKHAKKYGKFVSMKRVFVF